MQGFFKKCIQPVPHIFNRYRKECLQQSPLPRGSGTSRYTSGKLIGYCTWTNRYDCTDSIDIKAFRRMLRGMDNHTGSNDGSQETRKQWHQFCSHLQHRPTTNRPTYGGGRGSALVSIDEVNLRRARLVLGWVTVSGFDSRCRTFGMYPATHDNSAWPPFCV